MQGKVLIFAHYMYLGFLLTHSLGTYIFSMILSVILVHGVFYTEVVFSCLFTGLYESQKVLNFFEHQLHNKTSASL